MYPLISTLKAEILVPLLKVKVPTILLISESILTLSIILSVTGVSILFGFDANHKFWLSIVYLTDFLYFFGILSRPVLDHSAARIDVNHFTIYLRRYLKTSFTFDLLTIVPFEVIAALNPTIGAFIRINRVFRVYRIWKFLTKCERHFISYGPWIQSLLYVTLSGLSVQFIACFWYSLSCYNTAELIHDGCLSGTWANSSSIAIDINVYSASITQKYIVSLYWAISTLTSVGYGDIHAVSLSEKFIALVSMVWGVVMYGYILGGVTSTLTNLDAARGRYTQKLQAIKRYMKSAKISTVLFRRVTDYLEYNWSYRRGVIGKDLLEELPLALRNDARNEMYQDTMIASKLFHGVSPLFLRVLCSKVKELFFLPHQMIVNETDQYLYFMHKGTAEVAEKADPTHLLKELNPGDVFGEDPVGLESDDTSNEVIVTAKTHCHVLALSKNELDELVTNLSSERNVEKERRASYKRELEQSKCSNVILNMRNKFPTISRIILDKPLLPKSMFLLVWNFILFSFIITVCWLYPFQAGFSSYHHSVGFSNAPGSLFALTYLIDLVFVIDIIISLKKSFVTAKGYERDPVTIALAYLSSFTFLVDVAALVPMEILAAGVVANKLNWAVAFKINRLLKLWKVILWFDSLEKSLHHSISRVRGLKFLMYTILITHWSACAWFSIACDQLLVQRCKSTSWITMNKIGSSGSSPSVIHNYILSLYWSTTTTTLVGYGDIVPVNNDERVLAICVMLLGIWCYGYMLGSAAAIITHTLQPRVQFQKRLQAVQEFMKHNKLNRGLIERVNDFFAVLWTKSKGTSIPGVESILSHLPLSLQQDIKMEECFPLLSRVMFFNEISNEDFMKQISLSTVTHYFNIEDIILYHGDMSRNLYFVKKGYIEVLSEDLSHVIWTVPPGSHFGELGFFFGTPLTATVRSASQSEVFSISYHEVRRVLKGFPQLEKIFLELETDDDILSQLLHSFTTERLAPQTKRMSLEEEEDYVPHHSYKKQYSIVAGLAAAMVPTLAIATPPQSPPLVNAALSSVGPREMQSQLTPPTLLDYTLSANNKKRESVKQYSVSAIRYSNGEGSSDPAVSIQDIPITESSVTEVFHYEDDVSCCGLGLTRRKIIGKPLRCIYSQSGAIFGKILSHFLLDRYLLINESLATAWNSTAVILSIVTFLTVSFQASFYYSLPPVLAALLWVLNYFLDIFFIADMILKFHTSYYDKEGLLVMGKVDRAKHYIKTTFILDFIGLLPTELIAFTILWPLGLGPRTSLMSLTRLNRLIHIHRLVIFFNHIKNKMPKMIWLIKLLVYLLLSTHLIGCVWFMLSCSCLSVDNCCTLNSWANSGIFKNGSLISSSFSVQYMNSLYWSAATTATVGYGDIIPHRSLERLYTICFEVFGVLFYGLIVAYVTASLVNGDIGRVQYQEKLEMVKKYLKEHKVDGILKDRVINHYEHMWQRNKALNFHDLFKDMPPSLQSDVSLALYKNAIDKVPLFHNTGFGFTKLLALSMRPVLYLKGEYIIRKGDIGNEMYFISKGSVEIISNDGHGGTRLTVLDEGKFFGEISLVFDCSRTASVRTLCNCDLFVLSKSDFESALNKYQDVADQIKVVALQRATLSVLTDMVVSESLAKGKTKDETIESILEAAKTTAASSKRSSSVWGRLRTLSLRRPTVSTVITTVDEEMEERGEGEEESKGRRMSSSSTAAASKGIKKYMHFKWPGLRNCITFTLSPIGKPALFFTILTYTMAYISAFCLSYQIFFFNSSVGLSTINFLFEIYFLIEILIKFHLGYEDSSSGLIVRDFKLTFLHYLKSPFGFTLDFIAIFPFHILAAFTELIIGSHSVMSTYLKIPHFLRMLKFWRLFLIQEKKLDQKTTLIQAFKFFILTTLATQLAACFWFFLSCPSSSCHKDSWATAINLTLADSDTTRYITSLYWAVTTMTTVGYGDIVPQNYTEKLYAILIMIFGKLFYGFLLGSVASMLANRKKRQVMFMNKLDSIKDYIVGADVSISLERKVVHHCNHHWLESKGIDRQTLFDDTPYCLQSEIALATTQKLLQMVPVLNSVSGSLLRQLSLHLRPCYFSAGEIIISRGDVGHGLYFIYDGIVEKLLEEGRQSVPDPRSSSLAPLSTILSDGDYFGQENLTNDKHWARTDVFAASDCHLFLLRVEDFKALSDKHSKIKELVFDSNNY